MASIFSIYGEVFVDNAKATKGIKDITKEGDSADKSLASKFGNIAKNSLAIGAGVVTAASTVGGALFSMVSNTAAAASAINDNSIKVGMSAEEYQKIGYAAKLSGVEASKLDTLLKKQTTTFADAKQGSKSASDAYSKLGIDITKVGSASEAFDLVTARLADMKDETARNGIANDIFGKSYADLTPMIAGGSEELNKMKQEAVDLGGVMSNEAVAAGDNFGDSIDKLKTSFSGIANNLMSGLMPVAQTIIDMIVENMPMISDMFQSLAPILASVFTQLLPPLLNLVQLLMPSIISLINIILPVITQVLSAIMPLVIVLAESLLPPLLQLITAILPILMPLITTLASVFSAILTPAIKILGSVISGLTSIFSTVFGGVYEIVKKPINFMIDGINLFIEGVNKIKIPDWIPLIGGKSLNIPAIKKLQIGLDYVPMDNYPALLHKGEAVLTSEENKKRNSNINSGASAEDIAKAIHNELKHFVVMMGENQMGSFVDSRILKGAM